MSLEGFSQVKVRKDITVKDDKLRCGREIVSQWSQRACRAEQFSFVRIPHLKPKSFSRANMRHKTLGFVMEFDSYFGDAVPAQPRKREVNHRDSRDLNHRLGPI